MPSSTSCVAAVLGACCLTISLQQEDRTPLLQEVAHRWHLGKDARHPARASAGAPEEKLSAQCSDSGFPVDQDNGRGRQGARLRRGQKDQRHSKRHLLVDTQGLVLEARVHSAEIQDLKRASSSCWTRTCAIVCPSGSRTCGWTQATPARTRVLVGWKGCWDGQQRSSGTLRSWLRRR